MDTNVTVRSEPRTYSEHGEHSYFRDIFQAALNGNPSAGHNQRLGRHAVETDAEVASGSIEGRRAARVTREVRRDENRAMSTTSASGGTLVTPQYLTELFATFRSAHRAFVDQCRSLPLPEAGITFNVPSFASADSVGQQPGENSGVSQLDPTGADLSVTLTTQAGQVNVSQQFFDRGGFTGPGGSTDQIVMAQLASGLDASIDTYVINQATANAGSVTDATTLTIPLFYNDQAAAREKLTDTAGTRLAGTHLFSTSDFAGWVTRQVDSSNRPIVIPDGGSLMAVANDPLYEAYLGLVMPGGLKWFADDNIPAVGGNTQVIVARPQEILVWEGDPVSFAFPQTNAGNLSVLIGLRSYVAALPRYSKAVAVISGASYPTSLV